jgi:hypothetical protein
MLYSTESSDKSIMLVSLVPHQGQSRLNVLGREQGFAMKLEICLIGIKLVRISVSLPQSRLQAQSYHSIEPWKQLLGAMILVKISKMPRYLTSRPTVCRTTGMLYTGAMDRMKWAAATDPATEASCLEFPTPRMYESPLKSMESTAGKTDLFQRRRPSKAISIQ